MSAQDETRLTRWEWGIECYVKDRRGSMYLADEADQALAAKDARIADLECQLRAAHQVVDMLQADMESTKEMLEDRERDLEFEYGGRIKAEARVEDLEYMAEEKTDE
tara:strand:+ start:586 stop:906 length:321 start_codon:yes stop_codon:yes gene_type:complete